RAETEKREADLQRQLAEVERARAERRFKDEQQLASEFVRGLHESFANLPGTIEARQQMATIAIRSLDKLARESTGNSSLQVELARAYVKLGDAQGSPFGGSRGDSVAALKSYGQAEEILERAMKQWPSDRDVKSELAGVHAKLGAALPYVDTTKQAAANHH